MKYLISYDITDDKLRTQISKYLEEFATRLQFSLFICDVDRTRAKAIWTRLVQMAATDDERGLVLMTPLCKTCEKGMKIKGNPLESEQKFLVV